MFGKAEWFAECCGSKRLVPATWQGWLYALVWAGIVILPALLLLAQKGAAESIVWAAVTVAVVLWDLRQVRCQKRLAASESEDVLYIGDDDNSQLATRNFEMRLRN